ncbi:hypothetical protein C7457_1528 [Thermovibrio guaymasensis]|uniref:Uncharacterized protein n=1 Tax=Thermovibrio guaymasensis TaxID=240167 RepID=A0A420W5R5_9BACT|nr:hypothetical protein [Thermovibrio guaymasensis]RKQ60451.1 hypothetical protein C7457_1528 [Thermovibrio guaymasensis]
MSNPKEFFVYPSIVREGIKGNKEGAEEGLKRAFEQTKGLLLKNLEEGLNQENWEAVLSLLEELLTLYHLLLEKEKAAELTDEGIGFNEKFLERIADAIAYAEANFVEITAMAGILINYHDQEKELFHYWVEEEEKEVIEAFTRTSVEWGNYLSARKLYSTADKSLRLTAEALFGLTKWFKALERVEAPYLEGEILFLKELLTEAISSKERPKGKLFLTKLTYPLIEIPMIFKPSKELLQVGILLKDFLLKFSEEFTEFFESVLDRELPSDAARPQLLFVVKALVEFIADSGGDYDKAFKELSFFFKRYGVSKEELKETRTSFKEQLTYLPEKEE